MRIPRQPSQRGSWSSPTTVLLILFQVLLFLLVTSYLAQRELHLPLALPVATSAVRAPADAAPRLTIQVREQGQWWLAGHSILRDDLPVTLRRKVAAAGTELEVRIRSDRRVQYRHITPILHACAVAGIRHVTFAVQPPEEPR